MRRRSAFRPSILLLACLGLVVFLGLGVAGQSSEDWLERGQYLIRENRWDEALVALDKFKQMAPGDPRGYIYSGVALIRAGRKKDASIELNQTLSLKVLEPGDAILLSRAFFELGRLELASRYLGGELPPPPLYLRLNLQELTEEDLWYLCELHYQLGQAGSAWEVVEAYARRKPSDPRINLRKGQLRLLTEKPEEALEFLQRAVESDTASVDAAFFLGKALFQVTRRTSFTTGRTDPNVRGSFKTAKELVTRSLVLDPENVEYLHLLGSICEQLGEYQEAAEYLERAVNLIKAPVKIEFDLSRIYREVGERDKLSQEMSRYRAHFDLSRVYRKSGQVELARETMTRYRELYRVEELEQERLRELDELINRGLQQAQSGELRAALETFLVTIQKDPDNWWVHSYVALLYMGFGATDEAVKHAQKMLELDSDASDGYYFLASYWYQKQDYVQALDSASKAKHLRPGKPELRMLLGDILRHLSRPLDALEEYDAARHLVPGREVFEKRYKALAEQLSAEKTADN